MIRMDATVYSALGNSRRRRFSSVLDLTRQSSHDLSSVNVSPSNSKYSGDASCLNDDVSKVVPRRQLIRSSTALALRTKNEHSFKRVPILVLGKSDSLPDADDVMEKLHSASPSEESIVSSNSKSMCVVFDIDKLHGSDDTIKEISVDSDEVNSRLPSETVACAGSTVQCKQTRERAPLVRSVTENDRDNDDAVTALSRAPRRKPRPPLKRSQSEFGMNVPSWLVHNPDDPLEAFRARFCIDKQGKVSRGAEHNTSVAPLKTEEVNNCLAEGSSTVMNQCDQKVSNKSMLRKSKENSNTESVCSYAHESTTKSSEQLDKISKSGRGRRKKHVSESKKEKSCESRRSRSIERRRHNFHTGGISRSKMITFIEDTVSKSLSHNLPSLPDLISTEVKRQINERQAVSSEKPKINPDEVYKKVYETLLNHLSKSLNVAKVPTGSSHASRCRSPDKGDKSPKLCHRTIPNIENQSWQSVSCTDLSSSATMSSHRKLTPSLSFADLGLADSYPTSSNFGRNLTKEKPRTRSCELLDSSDIEVEGDLSHLPLEHHVPLRTALVPLCRQMSESIQNISCEDLTSKHEQQEPKTIAAKPKTRPKSLVLKLRVDLENLEGSRDDDPSNMEWDYYDQLRRDAWPSEDE